MITIYGIKNCATMKKAFDFFNEHGIVYEFFDYKKSVISLDTFNNFISHFKLQNVINKKGTTYKKLSDDEKSVIESGDIGAIYEIIKNNQSILKRPIVIVDTDDSIETSQIAGTLGFEVESYKAIFREFMK